MPLNIIHDKVSAIADGADTSLIRPSDWNSVHSLSGILGPGNGGTGTSSVLADGSVVIVGASGVYAADAGLTYNASTKTLSAVGGLRIAGDATVTNLYYITDSTTIRQVAESYSDTATAEPQINLRHARGSLATPTDTQDDDSLGSIRFAGYNADAGAFQVGAGIFAFADGEFGTSGDTTDSPGRLEFRTVPNGSSTAINRWVIDNAGNHSGTISSSVNWELGLSGTSMKFGTSSANALLIKTSDVTRMFIESGGQIGIGPATTLNALLEINNSTANEPLFQVTRTDVTKGFRFINYNGTDVAFKWQRSTDLSAWSEFMAWDPNTGDIGIGVADPDARLDIRKATEAILMLDNTTTAADTVATSMQFRNAENFMCAIRSIYRGGTAGANIDLDFFAAGDSGTPDMTLSGSKNLLIGTSTDAASMVGGIGMFNGTAPSGNVTDCFQMYSADQAAGNAAPHFRTENGDVIKLYKTGTYTPTNVTTDRSWDCNATTTEELADVLATLVADLQLLGILG